MILLLSFIFLIQAGGQIDVEKGAITGQLRDPEGMPIAGVRVAAADVDDDTGALVSIARTDVDGRYRLDGIPPGQYRISAGAVSTPTYFPGTTDRSSARRILITPGLIVDGLDFNIVSPLVPPDPFITLSGVFRSSPGSSGTALVATPGPAVSIAGRFVVEDGGVLPYGFVNLPLSYGTAPHNTATPSADGTFTLSLASGMDYFVGAPVRTDNLAGDYYVKSIEYGSADLLREPLKLNNVAPTSELRVSLARGARISGNVRKPNGDPASLTVHLVPRIPASQRPDLPRRTDTDSRGNFLLRGVAPGEYDIFSVSSLAAGREAVHVTVAGGAFPPLNLVLAPDGGLYIR